MTSEPFTDADLHSWLEQDEAGWPKDARPGRTDGRRVQVDDRAGARPQPMAFEDDSNRAHLPKITLTGDAGAMRVIRKAVNAPGLFPNLYVTNGELVETVDVSGDPTLAGLPDDKRPPLPIIARAVTPDSLAMTLATDTNVVEWKKRGRGDEAKLVEVEVTPPRSVLASVLSGRRWDGVRSLAGIVGTPVLRADGTLMQTPGYDRRTELFYAPQVSIEQIPTSPSADDVAASRDFILRKFLGGFPWVAKADKANYIGLLIAQILRPYFRSVLPFGLIDATTQSSGKTILSEGIGLLFGQRVRPWVKGDEELRKAITTVLSENAPTIVFDNIKEGSVVDSPVLAMLLTSPVYSDRLLGTNQNFSAANDRLWLATGNNIHLGGDMATRTVLIRLDPKMARPELRTDFEIQNLDLWVKNPDHRSVLLRHLLMLVMDWIAAGAKRSDHVMRQFTPWASVAGGFCAHHGIEGFLANTDDVIDLDEADAEWTAFLRRWYLIHGTGKKTSREVLESSRRDRWEGDFLPKAPKGEELTAVGLGAQIRGRIGRYHGRRYVLRKEVNHQNTGMWWVEDDKAGES